MAMAAESSVTAEPNKIKTFVKEEGKPMEVIFNDGRVIGFKLSYKFMPMRSSLTLSENSCTTAFGKKFEYVVPNIMRAILPYWKVHPKKAGQFVTRYNSDDKVDEVRSEMTHFSRLNDPKFAQRLNDFSEAAVEDKEALRTARAYPDQFGYLNCGTECEGVLPSNRLVQFWDENFELGAPETMMVTNDDGPSLNQMSSRLQEMQMTVKDGYILFGKPARTYGFFALFFPPGITYQIQWNIQSQNLIDNLDSLCQLRWDMDFTRVFNIFDGASVQVTDIAQANKGQFKIYNFTPDDTSVMSINSLFIDSLWESAEIHK